jgi:ABC-type dipeptide/oligopeptide/nickel transport system ATPase component
VADSTFSLGQGERLGIVGESGSGKSLTLRSIAGILPPALHSTGDIHFTSERGRRDLAMIFQEPATSLNPTMRVGDFVAAAWQLHHADCSKHEAHERAAELLGKVGIDEPESRMGAWPFELSGGLRQRIMIAGALAASPSVLLCDEPTTALDVRVQAQIMQLLSDIVEREGLSLIFVSHDLAVISEICTRIIVMRHGRIVESGDSDELIHHPKNEYTRTLLDADLDYRLSLIGKEGR